MSEATTATRERAAQAGLAQDFYQAGTEQLDTHVLYGEELAKAGVLVAMVLRKNLLLSGLPGGGKSTLASSMHRLVEGVNPDNVLWIPGQHDMTATQLVGGVINREEDIENINEAGETASKWTEKRGLHVKGIIHPETEFFVLDELTRMNPYVVNAVNPALENRRIEAAGVKTELPGLIATAATVNPSESKEATFKLTNATKSRFTIGAVMGEYEPAGADTLPDAAKRAYRKNLNEEVRKFKGNPEDVEAVISKTDLASLHDYAARALVKNAMPSLIGDLAIDTAEAIQGHGVTETDRRIVNQIEAIAKTFAALRNGDNVVTEPDVTDATEMVIAARLGAHGTRGGQSPTAVADSVTSKYAS